MKAYLAYFLITLGSIAQAQKFCENCVSDTFDYLCNGQNCEGFSFKSLNTHPIISGVSCKLKSPCYYKDSYDNVTTTYYFVACNYSMGGCGDCFEKNDCAMCYAGYHFYNADIQTSNNICRACSDSIAGCLKCSSASNCQVCDTKYRMIAGLCYNQDGTLVNGESSSTTGIFILLIILTIFAGIGLVLIGLVAKKKLFRKKGQEPLMTVAD